MNITINRVLHLMRTVTYVLLLMLSAQMGAQTVQKGVVKEYNEKDQKTPLGGVELNIISAQSTASDTDGKFELSFQLRYWKKMKAEMKLN